MPIYIDFENILFSPWFDFIFILPILYPGQNQCGQFVYLLLVSSSQIGKPLSQARVNMFSSYLTFKDKTWPSFQVDTLRQLKIVGLCWVFWFVLLVWVTNCIDELAAIFWSNCCNTWAKIKKVAVPLYLLAWHVTFWISFSNPRVGGHQVWRLI